MSGASTVGGLLALIGGLLILLQTFINWSLFWVTWPVADIVNLGIGGAALIGGVFGMKGQRGAGGLALVVGILSIILGLVTMLVLITNLSFAQFSLIQETLLPTVLSPTLLAGISIEAILISIGGILILAGGSE